MVPQSLADVPLLVTGGADLAALWSVPLRDSRAGLTAAREELDHTPGVTLGEGLRRLWELCTATVPGR